jgi:hypothetical protein
VAAAIGCTAKPVVHTVTGRDQPGVGGDRAGRLDPGDVGVFVDGDAEPVEDSAQVPLGLLVEPVAEAAAGGDRDVEVRPGLGDLGGRLEAGEAPADDQHGSAGGEVAEALAQPQRGPLAGDVVRVLGDAGYPMVGGRAAEGVHESVIADLLVDESDGLAIGVDGGHPCQPELHARARVDVAQLAALEFLSGRELVHPDPLDEIGVGVDDGDLGLVAVQPAGEAPGGDGSGVSGPEDDDAMFHGLAPVSVCCFLNRTAMRFLTGAGYDLGHQAPRRGSPCPDADHSRVTRTSLSGLTWTRMAAIPSAVNSSDMTPTTRSPSTTTTAGPPLTTST